jgi:Zn-dependent protease
MTDFVIIIPIILFALTIHEYSHGWVAYRLGDNTAYLQGRLTLNPLKHLDPIGTIMFIFLHFGWAKPVPVDATNFRYPRKDMMLVGFAGPLANIFCALVFGMIFRLLGSFQAQFSNLIFPAMHLLGWGIILNLALAIFNMLPISPLDGSHILKGLLPLNLAYKYSMYEHQGRMILLGLIIFGYITGIHILGHIIWPPVKILARLFSGANLLP